MNRRSESLVRTVSVAILATLFIVPALAGAQEPAEAAVSYRSGFTIELGLGAGLTTSMPDEGDGESKFGLAGLSIGIGGFVNPSLAILGRISGTTYSADAGSESVSFTNSTLLAAAQYWIDDRIFVGGGAGLAVTGPAFYEDLDVDSENGVALEARAGYGVMNSRNHSLRVSLEVLPTFYDGAKLISSLLTLDYQFL